MIREILKPIIVCLVLQHSVAQGQTAGEMPRRDHHGAETAIREVEDRRLQAMMQRDFAALESLLADDLTYTHTNGRVDGKSELLSAMQAGALIYESIELLEARVRVYEATAVVTGTASMQVKAGNQQISFQARFTDVYVNQSGLWKMVAWQSTRIPEQEAKKSSDDK